MSWIDWRAAEVALFDPHFRPRPGYRRVRNGEASLISCKTQNKLSPLFILVSHKVDHIILEFYDVAHRQVDLYALYSKAAQGV